MADRYGFENNFIFFQNHTCLLSDTPYPKMWEDGAANMNFGGNNMNPANLMKLMQAQKTFQANHPKFVSFLGYVLNGGIQEGTVIEITVTKPGEEPVTSNMKVQQSDLDLFNSLKDMK